MRRDVLWSAVCLMGAVGCVESKAIEDLGTPWTRDSDFAAAVEDDALPGHFTTAAVSALDNSPTDNPVTDAGATLGRALFYDPRLSINQTVSCASCHAPGDAFADEATLSVGFDGGETGRHGMPLVNVRWYARGGMFWDERADTLEEQVLMPIQDSVEMGMSLEQLEHRLDGIEAYGPLFEDAFGDSAATSDRVSRALAQFVRALVSVDSPYDQGLAVPGSARVDLPTLYDDENDGRALFFGRAGCAACHVSQGGPGAQEAVFYVDRPVNNGLDAQSDDDGGVGDVSGRARDDGLFKSPSLRNIAVTGPYMHDGRFDTLAEVVDHYRRGVQSHSNLDPRMARVAQDLTDVEAAQLVAFMESLTDTAFLTDARYEDRWIDGVDTGATD